MNRRLQLWLGVSACALLGALTLPVPAFAEQGSSQDNDLDPHGGFQHECGEPGGCAEAGESFESTTPDERGEDDGSQPLVRPAQPRSGNGGLSTGDSIRGGVNDGGLGD
ncbi:hypothetical protein [Dongia deserti]|uniref:hypothetical protein n=1 Tax=Dongia deserti TaxID=2268030 RepID=UPI0013C4FF5D|nr:hypothetical protein [Dongia deserti]